MVGDAHLLYAIHVLDRMKDAPKVQQVFSEYGCHIKTRVGFHEVKGDFCSPGGVIILEMFGDPAPCAELKDKLSVIDGLEVQEIRFSH
jgi:hypothetical protein